MDRPSGSIRSFFRRCAPVVLAALSVAACAPAPEDSAQNSNTARPPRDDASHFSFPAEPLPVAAHGVLVKFRSPESLVGFASVLDTAGASIAAEFQIVPGLVHAHVSDSMTLEQCLATLRADPNVEYAEPNYLRSINVVPNDPQFAQLWGLHNTGQSSGLADADIDAPEAWDTETGTDTVIAVIDTGVDYTHDDLKDNIWTNPGEIPNNGVDDDGNGFVDDVHGWDFANNDNDPMDDHFHGTHVAGTIAASGNNGIGVVGVSWRARIMALKFITNSGGGSDVDAIKAIEYAAKMGARVSNNSWGGSGDSRALRDAIANAANLGHLFIAAAGNDGSDNDRRAIYPASYDLPNIIAVAATDRSDKKATFSNFGLTTVDLGAPGVDILSTAPKNSYRSLQGTSMATPHVVGAAGLLFSYMPGLTFADVKTTLMQSVDPIAALAGKTVTGGRLNVAKALQLLGGRVRVTPARADVPLRGTLQFAASDGTAPYTWSVTDSTVASISGTGLLTALAMGKTRVEATDSNGAKGSSGDITVTSTRVTPNAGLVAIGGTLQFTASGGTVPYLWSSSNTAAATISSAGLLTGVSGGTVTVTATDANGVAATTGNVQIVNPVLPVTPRTAIVGVGSTLEFSVSGGTAPYTWFSADTNVAAIDSATGVLTALDAGTTFVGVRDAQNVYGLSNAIAVRNIVVSPQTAQLNTGQSMPFTASGGRAPYTWFVSDTQVASIDADGVLTALAGGMVTVVATDADGAAGRSGTIVVVGSSQLTISPTNASLKVGDTLQFKVLGGFPPYQWLSSNPTAASINNTGLLTARATGFTFVSATDSRGNRTSSSLIQIRQINVSPNTATVNVGQTAQFFATGGSLPYTWSVSNPQLASISATGALVGLAAGAVTVTATDATGLAGTSGNITIVAGTSPTLRIQPGSAQLTVGQTLQFSASGGSTPYRWSSSAPTVASIDAATGLLIARAAGSATITVTDSRSASASASVTVISGGGGGGGGALTVTPGGVQIVRVGATLKFTASGGAAPYTWSTSNPGVGTVDANGVFTGAAPGINSVIVRDASGRVASSSNIIVSQ